MRNSSLKSFSFLLIVAASVLGVAACKTQDTITSAQAAAVGRTAVDAVFMAENASNALNYASPSWSNSYASLTGTREVVGTVSTYNWTITLSGYADAGSGYMVSGQLNYADQMDSTTHIFSGTLSGTLTVSGGLDTTAVLNMAFSGSTVSVTAAYTGTLTCEGTQFDASTLSLDRIYEVMNADAALHDGRTLITDNESSWVPATGAVAYTSPAGAMMTGNVTTAGNISTYDLSITFTNFDDSVDSGYTIVSGTMRWQATVDNSGAPKPVMLTATSTGSLVLSGGPVSSESWSIGYTSTGGLTGTFTCKGIVYDARILYSI